MKTFYFLLLGLMTLSFGCKKSDEGSDNRTDNSPSVPLYVTVFNGDTWSGPGTGSLEAGVSVKIFNDSVSKVATTNDNGVAVFTNLKRGSYKIVATKDNLSNILAKDDQTGKGFITDGIFQDSAEVKYYTWTGTDGKTVKIQPDAVPGDFRIVDLNNDGIINADDKDTGSAFFFETYKDVNEDWVIDENDKVNGAYQLTDKKVETSVSIGSKVPTGL